MIGAALWHWPCNRGASWIVSCSRNILHCDPGSSSSPRIGLCGTTARGETMPLHWSYKSLPELSALRDAERTDAWKKATREAYGQRQSFLAMVIVPFVMAMGGSWLGSMFGSSFLGLLIGIWLGAAIAYRIVFRIARSCLKKTLAS